METRKITVTINGQAHTREVETRLLLADPEHLLLAI